MNLPDEKQTSELYDILMTKIDPDLTSQNLPNFREQLARKNKHEQERIMKKKAQSLGKYEVELKKLSKDYKNHLRKYYVEFLEDAEEHYNEHQLQSILAKLDEELNKL